LKFFLDASFLIYLSALTNDDRSAFEDLFKKLLREDLYINLLVVDETLYISTRKYGVSYDATLNFFENIILPYVEPITIDESDFKTVKKYLLKYAVKPSNAIHLATMEKKGISHIVSEDDDFDRVKEVRRIWLPSSYL
jgi:predicted nucleic acid-binding protein